METKVTRKTTKEDLVELLKKVNKHNSELVEKLRVINDEWKKRFKEEFEIREGTALINVDEINRFLKLEGQLNAKIIREEELRSQNADLLSIVKKLSDKL